MYRRIGELLGDAGEREKERHQLREENRNRILLTGIFLDQDITGDILLELTLDAVKELGIPTYGKRYKVMLAINNLKAQQEGSRNDDVSLFFFFCLPYRASLMVVILGPPSKATQ